ncbi:MAG: division/outer membrane stress-associated lipid-binding lipoprotein [Gammaproteobacteria bacterium]|nr:MAG: division/outer membrane stress-associated lipid-binding lipoprotein [Gammaproteobacteria bacterium]
MTNKQKIYSLLGSLLMVTLLQGCTGAVVGGAAAGGAAVIHDRRSAGTIIDDQVIELKAFDRINGNAEILENTHVNVKSHNYVVLITGEAPTEKLKNDVYELIKTIPKVKRIHNELIIAAPSSYTSRTSDSWITAKVKTAMFKITDIEGFDSTRVRVVTDNGSVFLMGLVKRNEADAVTELVRKISGVQRVIKVFEYLD